MNGDPPGFVEVRTGFPSPSVEPSEGQGMRDDASLDYRGTRVKEVPKRNRTYPAGRVCADPGCETRLSVYNKANLCWQHEPVRPYFERGRKPKREAA
jgi:hypothetical protein